MKAAETIELYGPRVLSDREVFSLLVGNEVGGVLYDYYGSLSNLAKRSLSELRSVKGVGPRKAQIVAAAFDLSRRVKQPEILAIKSSYDAYMVVSSQLELLDQEEFWVLALNTKHHVVAMRMVAKGTVSGVEVHPRDVFSVCIAEKAVSCIVAHNHPSGDVSPSDQDVSLTNRLFKAGEILGVPLLDHLIVGNDKYMSFADRGLI